MLYAVSFASSSDGCCIYVASSKNAILVDIGISYKKIIERLESINKKMEKVNAILISHAHQDHFNPTTVRQIIQKYNTPIYMTNNVLESIKDKIDIDSNVKTITTNKVIKIGDLSIKSSEAKHDVPTINFTISSSKKQIAIITDTGHISKDMISKAKNCGAIFLEANYDIDMLESGNYPKFLRERIKRAHLENKVGADFIVNNTNGKLQCLILAHVSKNTNSIEAIQKAYSKINKQCSIQIAPRDGLSEPVILK